MLTVARRKSKCLGSPRHRRKDAVIMFRRNRRIPEQHATRGTGTRTVQMLRRNGRIYQHPIHGRILKLEQIVPGCRQLDTGSVFQRTADYISFLQFQVKLMQGLCNVYGL